MPGDLSDENFGPYVGYYEKRYEPSSEWSLNSGYGNLPGYLPLNPEGKKTENVLLKMVKNHLEQDKEEAK